MAHIGRPWDGQEIPEATQKHYVDISNMVEEMVAPKRLLNQDELALVRHQLGDATSETVTRLLEEIDVLTHMKNVLTLSLATLKTEGTL